MDEERYRPGLLDLNLQISIVKNFHHLQYQLRLTTKLEEEYKNFKETKCAILNLRGAILYFLKDYEESLKEFGKVLDLDKSNLNALKNLESIYRQLGFWSKADEYQKSLKTDPVSKAICYGEQGFAMMFDCHISSCEYERCKRSQNKFEWCLKLMAEAKVESCVAVQWHVWYAQLLSRLVNSCMRNTQTDERYQYRADGIGQCLHVKEIFTENGQMINLPSPDKKRLLSLAMTYLGVFMHKVDSKEKDILKLVFTDVNQDVVPDKDDQSAEAEDRKVTEEMNTKVKEIRSIIKKSLKDPKLVFEAALKILEDAEIAFKEAEELDNNTEVICRYALFLKGKKIETGQDTNYTQKLMENLKAAENLVDQCINGENGGNWFVFTIKSSIVLAKCKPQYQKLKVQLGKGNDTALVDTDQSLDSNSKEEELSGETARDTVWLDSSADLYDTTLDNWLKESIKYGEKAGKINATSKIYSDLGEAYHWLALNQKIKNNRDTYFLKALSSFLHALQHAEGNRNSFIHYCHGKCLLDMEQYLPALESFKRAIECGTKRLNQTYKKLCRCYIEQMSYTKDGQQIENGNQLLSDLAYWIKLRHEKFGDKGFWLDEMLKKLHKKVQNVPEKSAKIDETFAKIAKELKNLDSLRVSKEYLMDHTNFVLHIFGETLHLQNKDYSKQCIETLNDDRINELKESERKECLDIIIKACTDLKDSFHKSNYIEYNQAEAFLRDVFKDLEKQCPKFTQIAAQKITETNNLLGLVLFSKEDSGTTLLSEISESSVGNMSMRELHYCLRNLDAMDDKFKICLNQFEVCIDKLSTKEPVSGEKQMLTSEPKVRKTKYEYDFAVINSENDSQWVVHSLLPTLELKYGFRGYVEDRDLVPGQSRFNILDILEKCYRIIVILSENFCDDKWSYFVFQQALFGKIGEQSLIPIQRSQLKQIPKELSTIISLPAVQNLDWERLVKELE